MNGKHKKIMLGAAAVVAVSVLAWTQTRAQARPAQETAQTFTLARESLTQTVSASGAVKSENAHYIYAALQNPVQEILVAEGDRVRAGDVLARLDVGKLVNDIAQAEINLQNAEQNAEEEARQNGNGVVNAQNALSSSRITLERQALAAANAEDDLREAETPEAFDGYAYDKAVTEAAIALARKQADLADALADLDESLHDFDDYAYQNAIREAAVTLARKQADLADALDDLAQEKKERVKAFDGYAYENAVSDAENNYQRKQDDYAKAQQQYYTAHSDYAAAAPETVDAALSKITGAQTAMDTAERAAQDAEAAVTRARDDLARAKKEYNTTAKDNKETVLTAAENKAVNAQNAFDDAERAHQKALTDLDRAQRDGAKAAADQADRARDVLADAQRSYDNALADRQRAEDDFAEASETQLENARKNLRDSQKQLASAKNSVDSAVNGLHQANAKPEPTGANARLQALALERLRDQLAESEIIATADGVITEVNVKVGAAPSGILFVIEDVDKLYVSANVKEYSLSELRLGQKAYVTTDATGDAVYEGALSYLSPKAVSPAGSTSVEFETRAAVDGHDGLIRIGMNAFLNIVTDERADVFTAPLSAVVTDARGSFVYALTDNERAEIPVTLGLRTSTHAEIDGEGLTEGMELITFPNGLAENTQPTGMMMMGGR